MKVLILRFSSIGDIVLTTPVIRCLKQQLKGVSVHYATRQSYTAVLAANPYIDQLHFLAEDQDAFIEQLKAESFDHIIDLHHNWLTWGIKRKLGIKHTSFRKLNPEKWAMVNFKLNLLPKTHIVDRYLDTVAPLGVKNDGAGLDHFLSAADEFTVDRLPAAFQAGFHAFAIGAKYATKQLPWEQIATIISLSKMPFALLGGPEDAEKGDKIAGQVGESALSFCGKLNLGESSSLLRAAQKLVTHDTGLMHIAAAYKMPICSIWGNTVPEFGMYPYFGGTQPLDNYLDTGHIAQVALPCRPCSKIGFSSCPKRHFSCMKLQDTQQIVAWLSR